MGAPLRPHTLSTVSVDAGCCSGTSPNWWAVKERDNKRDIEGMRVHVHVVFYRSEKSRGGKRVPEGDHPGRGGGGRRTSWGKVRLMMLGKRVLLLAQTLKTAGVSYWLLVQQGCFSHILPLKNTERAMLDPGQSGQTAVTPDEYSRKRTPAEAFKVSD